MPLAFVVWLVLLGLIGLVWASRHLEISRARRTERALSSATYADPPADAPRISVLVAAKDEEENIAACVRSFLDQDYPNFELIVINDRSSDRTGEILGEFARQHDRLQAGGQRGQAPREAWFSTSRTQSDSEPVPCCHGRLRVVTITALRDGWFGKSNAMREGVAVATGDWLCFSDADCTQTSTRTLAAALQECRSQSIDFLSVLPVLATQSFWERIIQPVCAGVMMLWFRPERVNDPRSSAAYANGAFMLMSRSVYEGIGGHEAVRTQLNEDMHMARIAKERGYVLRVIRNTDLYVTRMYASLGAAWRGWTRIFYGCLGSFRRLFIALMVLTLLSLSPWVGLLVAGAGVYGAGEGELAAGWRWLLGVSAVVVILEQSVIARFYKLVRMPGLYSVGYPLGALITWGMLVNAMLKLGGATTTTWRGTTYRAGRLDSTEPQTSPAAGPTENA
ncbi:MAG: glycosyltransferase family A protein [Planctomycetota bacterium]